MPILNMIDYLRSFRLLNIAMFDVVMSILVFYFLIIYLYPNAKHPWLYSLISIPVGIVVHMLFSINTTLNNYLGLSDKPKRSA